MILTEQMVIKHLGQPQKIEGNELVYQCPICMDRGKNNLKYNRVKNVLKCFSAGGDTHSPLIYAQIMKDNKPELLPKSMKLYDRESTAFFKYQEECNQALLANDKALKYLYENTLIDIFTVKNCGIGYDFDDKRWVFPVYDVLDMKLKGFEYRGADLTNKSIWKEKDTPACLSLVWGKLKNKKLYICEGFKDAYILAQWLDYNEDVTIMTPSNGVGSLENVLPTLILDNFEIINLCLDNDDAGQKALKSIREIYPFMVDKTPKPKKGKDIGDLYYEQKNKG